MKFAVPGPRLVRIAKAVFFLLLGLATLAMLFEAFELHDHAMPDIPGRNVMVVTQVSVTDAHGTVKDYALPVTLRTGEPFSFRFDVPPRDRRPADVLSMQANYMDFEVYFDGRRIYDYAVGDRTIIPSGGYLLHFIDLWDAPAGGTIEIHVTPRLPRLNVQKLSVMYLGRSAQITLDRLVGDLPVLMISLVIVLFFTVVFLMFPNRKRAGQADYMLLFHMAFLGIILTSYILLQTWTINMVLRHFHLLVYVLEFSVLAIMPLPVLMVLRGHVTGLLRRLLSVNIWLLWTNLFAQYVITLTGWREMREMLGVTHVLFGGCIVMVSAVMVHMIRHRTPQTNAVLTSVMPLLIGLTVGIIVYLSTGLLMSPLVLQIPFVIFLIAQAIAAMERYARLRENAMQSQTYRQLASKDLMTGLDNRNAFNDLSGQIAAMHQAGWVVMMDLNNLKRVNDIHGHRAGDELIKAFAGRMQRETMALSDSKLYRLGGDEFLLYTLEDGDFPMEAWLSRLRASFEEGWPEDLTARPEFSFGAYFHDGYEQLDTAVLRADQRMYADKSRQREIGLEAALN